MNITVNNLNEPVVVWRGAAWINSHRISLAKTGLTENELEELAPYLHYVDCRELNLKDPEGFIARCSNAKELLVKTDQLKELKSLPPHLQLLDCRGCKALTTLELLDAPALQVLVCSDCTALTTLSLPNTPQLQELYCHRCTSLISLSLPQAPQLQKIYSHRCTALRSIELGHVPLLEKLECPQCTALTTLSLPDTPQLKELLCERSGIAELSLPIAPLVNRINCHECRSLRRISIPDAPSLEAVLSAGCDALTTLSLPKAPSLRRIYCSGDLRLTTIEAEAFRSLIELDCKGSPIKGFPQVPSTARIYNESFITLIVNPHVLEIDPLYVLLHLATYLSENKPLPNIVWPEPLRNGGGERQQLLTTLFENLFKEGSQFSFTARLGGKIPLLSDLNNQVEVLALRTLARLIALCATSSLLLGDHLPHSFFYAVRARIVQEEDLSDLELSEAATYDTQRDAYQKLRPIRQAVEVVAQELQNIPRFSLDRLRNDPDRFIESVKGKPVAKETLLAHMRFEGMREYFEQYIEEYPQKLTTLVELFTSCRTLGGKPIAIRVDPEKDIEQLPRIHAFEHEVEMPLYPAYQFFKDKLNRVLSSVH